MKQFSIGPVRNWFGYTRRERRASFVLLILILAVTFIRFIIPDNRIAIEEITLSDQVFTEDLRLSGNDKNTGLSYQKPPRTYQQKRAKIELNTCDSASLEALPGIGPVLSARIIRYRNLLGGFTSVSQLREVYGLPEETFSLISDRLVADSSFIRKINLNTADFKQLIRLPYFERYEVTAILKYREMRVKIDNLNELVANKLVTQEKMKKIRPYIEIPE